MVPSAAHRTYIQPGHVALAAWFVVMVVVGAGLVARHLVALPVPNVARSGLSLSLLGVVPAHDRLTAVHVLSSTCGCSRRVAAHLTSDPRPASWDESVVWIGDGDPPPELTRAFPIHRATASTLALAGVEGAPVLLAVTRDGEVAYAGGYTDRKQASTVHDLEILEAVQQGKAPTPLPLFGCATSRRTRNALARLPIPERTP